MQFDKISFKDAWRIYFQVQVDVKLKKLMYLSQDAKGNNFSAVES